MGLRYSRRLPWTAERNALSRLVDARRAAGLAILDLTESNPTRAGLPLPGDGIRAALADAAGSAAVLGYAPDPQGALEARRAVAGHHARRGVAVRAEDLVLASSTSEAYAWIFKLLCDPGDAVLVPSPSYPLFDFLAGLEAVRTVPYPLAYDGEWHVDLAALREIIAATHNARAIVVVDPNNPTGSFLKRAERDALFSLARGCELAVLVDAVFADYPLAGSAHAPPGWGEGAVTDDERAVLRFTLGGLSKALALPQLKLGWIDLAGPGEERERARARLELVADTYLPISAPVQLALPRLLALADGIVATLRARLDENLAALVAAVAGTACQVLRAEGGWYAVVRVPATRSDEEWALDLLDRDGVLVQPGYFYDFERGAYLVLSLLPPVEEFREAARRIVARVAAATLNRA